MTSNWLPESHPLFCQLRQVISHVWESHCEQLRRRRDWWIWLFDLSQHTVSDLWRRIILAPFLPANCQKPYGVGNKTRRLSIHLILSHVTFALKKKVFLGTLTVCLQALHELLTTCEFNSERHRSSPAAVFLCSKSWALHCVFIQKL